MHTRLLLVMVMLFATGAFAKGERSGDFDYYVLALSWSPNWCAREGDARGSDQCHPRHDFGWILHGLWPQNERGWPSFCQGAQANPSRRQTSEMADIMGTGGLAWHQWNKHGRCSGLEATDYFKTSRDAFNAVTRPEVLRRLDTSVRLPARVIEEAFLEVNPSLSSDMITVTCKDNYIQEVRICLTKSLSPRTCGAEVSRDCTRESAIFDPVR